MVMTRSQRKKRNQAIEENNDNQNKKSRKDEHNEKSKHPEWKVCLYFFLDYFCFPSFIAFLSLVFFVVSSHVHFFIFLLVVGVTSCFG
jgi:hypothetical protein